MARYHHSRGFLRSTFLLGLANASLAASLLAQIGVNPPSSADLLIKVLPQLGVAGVLGLLCWFIHQQSLSLQAQLLAQAEQHGKAMLEKEEQNGKAIAAEKQLRIDEAVEFGHRLDAIHTAGKNELAQLHAQAGAERAQLLGHALEPRTPKGKSK